MVQHRQGGGGGDRRLTDPGRNKGNTRLIHATSVRIAQDSDKTYLW